MALKAIYDSKEDIPEQFQELYTERDGKFELTGIEGIKTQADVDRVQEALRKEKNDHKDTKDKLKTFEEVDLEQVKKDQDELTELRAKIEAGAGEGFDQEKFDEAVDKLANARVATAKAPLEKDLEKVTKERDELKDQNDQYAHKETVRTITDAVRRAAGESKVIDSAMDDIIMLGERVFEITEDGKVVTRDEVGVTPGIAPDIWLAEMQDKRPHWWPMSQGGGGKGGNGAGGFANNPWSHEHWNMTAQGKMVREDRDKADRMAQAAGTKVGGTRPAPRTQTAQNQGQ